MYIVQSTLNLKTFRKILHTVVSGTDYLLLRQKVKKPVPETIIPDPASTK
jgi:hypothetical protein